MYEKILKMNESYTTKMIAYQEIDPKSKYYGGIIDPISGVALPSHGHTPKVIGVWVSSIVNPDSSYYHDIDLLKRIELATDYMLNNQHTDGTISLGSTNYHSPPDTGFVVVGLSQVLQVLYTDKWNQLGIVKINIKLFLERAIPALLTGGIHTPNHRWVVSAGLAFLYEIFKVESLLDRVNSWLAEGLDYTEDGEWTERSNGIYNVINDIMLYHLSRILEKPALLDPVRKNLEMMQYLIHPSGEIVTDYSGRQDFGVEADLSNYYLIYQLMASHDQNPLFAHMADLGARAMTEPGSIENNAMIGHLLHPNLRCDTQERESIPEKYQVIINKTYPRSTYLDISKNREKVDFLHSSPHYAFGSPVVRYRKKDISATIMTNTPSFFSLRNGMARLLGVKVSTSFSPGIVYFDEFEEIKGGYRLRKVMEKGYNGPIPKEHLEKLNILEEVPPWYLLPHEYRPITHLQKHEIVIDIIPDEEAFRIHVQSNDLKEVFTQITFIFGAEGTIKGDRVEQLNREQYFLVADDLDYIFDEKIINISPGAHEHRLDVLRDDIHAANCKNVSVNLMTPIDIEFDVKLS